MLINNATYQRETLSERPIRQPLSSLTCKLYHEYGHLLAPIDAAIITSSHLTPATKLPLEAAKLEAPLETPLEELKPELKPEDY